MSKTTAGTPDYGPVVDAMLDAAGIKPSAEERDQLLEAYALHRPGVAALYEVPDARYEVPALVFQAEPKLAQWGT